MSNVRSYAIAFVFEWGYRGGRFTRKQAAFVKYRQAAFGVRMMQLWMSAGYVCADIRPTKRTKSSYSNIKPAAGSKCMKPKT